MDSAWTAHISQSLFLSKAVRDLREQVYAQFIVSKGKQELLFPTSWDTEKQMLSD